MKVSEAAARWGLSSRRVRALCAAGRISGVVRKGNLYMIPSGAVKPTDARVSHTPDPQYATLLERVDRLKEQFSQYRPRRGLHEGFSPQYPAERKQKAAPANRRW